MSEIRATTISDINGTGPVSLTNQSAAKSYFRINATNTTIDKSLNISSLDDDGIGDWGLHFTSNFGDALYAMSLGNEDGSAVNGVRNSDITTGTVTTSAFDAETYYVTATDNRTSADNANFGSVYGDLA